MPELQEQMRSDVQILAMREMNLNCTDRNSRNDFLVTAMGKHTRTTIPSALAVEAYCQHLLC